MSDVLTQRNMAVESSPFELDLVCNRRKHGSGGKNYFDIYIEGGQKHHMKWGGVLAQKNIQEGRCPFGLSTLIEKLCREEERNQRGGGFMHPPSRAARAEANGCRACPFSL